jgi:hypothetical protein
MERITERRAHIQERTSKNELELALDRMISSWFRWYWLALASFLLLGFGADIWSIEAALRTLNIGDSNVSSTPPN